MKSGIALKIFFGPLFYRLEWNEERDPWGRVTFKFYPRVTPIYIGIALLSPLIFILSGISGVAAAFKKPKVQSWSSYYIKKGEVAHWVNAYRLL